MVLQSLLQFRAFEHSEEVHRLRDLHHHIHEAKGREQERETEQRSLPSDQTRCESDDETSAATSPIEATSNEAGDAYPSVEATTLKRAQDGKPDPFLIEWSSGEPSNPQNWSWTRKWCLVIMVTAIGLLVGVAASIDSAAAKFAASKFGVSEEVVELQTAVFLIVSCAASINVEALQ